MFISLELDHTESIAKQYSDEEEPEVPDKAPCLCKKCEGWIY